MKKVSLLFVLVLLPAMLMAQKAGGEVKRQTISQSPRSPWSAYIGKQLYLVAYGTYDNPCVCTFGEHILLGKNGTMSWNSRSGGNSTSHRYRINGKKILFDDNSFEITKAQGKYLLMRCGDDVLRMFSTSPQRVINGHGADIQKFYLEQNVVRNGERGLIAHLDVQFVKAKGHDLRVSVYFDSPENCGLVDVNGRYAGANNVVCTELSINNNNDFNPSWCRDLQLFIPYSELHVTSQGIVDIACHAYVHDVTLGGQDRMYWLTKSDFLHFSYNSGNQSAYNTGTPMIGSAVPYMQMLR